MTEREPPGLAPHIPADLYRQAEATGRPIVIIHTNTPTGPSAGTYLLPIAVGCAGAIGIIGTIAALLALVEFAAHTAALIAATAGPIGIGGITLKLFHPKHK
ncbi:hypothetical protein OG257_16085 [Streptomyces sp. NBC_00683]|uniref:hypothetical protein n=1 Tax=Streptomyces sp. NBC_00683 TaxID=2903670 RepID=UPI002E323777|nr:hypothetical protein [Streptomyces sp. NBC_00683]